MERPNKIKLNDDKKTYLYVLGSIVGIAIIVFIISFVIYGGGPSENEGSKFSTAKVSNLVPNESTNILSNQASSQIGKSVNEAKETKSDEKDTANTNKTEDKNSNTSNSGKSNTSKENNIATNTKNTSSENKEENAKKLETTKNEEKDPVFTMPVDGEVLREYAKDKLVYSDTLKEWITHPGVDIKAEKTSVVKSSADGRISIIKNDPRYGLTVIIEHTNGFKTIYSNLLTAEFITAGEEVASGQTIGTIGNTATFEVLDEPHLHFEILKDNENIDPTIYLKQ